MNRLYFFMLSLLLFSCSSKKKDTDNIYFHYRVWGDEESGIVTAKLQYYFGGKNGNAVLINEGGKVEIDGREIKADSFPLSGPYYELVSSVNEFAGRHTIVFTGAGNKKYETAFDYAVISLKEPLPEIVHREDIVLEIAGLRQDDRVRLLLNDTSFYGRGIEKIDTVKAGRIVITGNELQRLKSGPVYLTLSREEERALPAAGKKRGWLSVSYELKREFMLED